MIREILAASGEVGTGKTHTLCVSKNIVMKSHSVLSGVLKRIREIKVLFLLLLAANSLYAAYEPYMGWNFRSEGDVVVLGGYRGDDDYYNASGGGTSQKPNSGSIEIPSHSYDGKPLVAIRACAFAYWDGVQEFIIPSTVTNLSSLAFQRQHPLYSSVWYGLSSVTSLVFKGNAPDITNPSEFKKSLPNCTVYVSVSSSGWDVDIPGEWKGLPIKYLPQSYSVKFNANGGSGTMANQSFDYGVSKNLTANRFSRNGYSFAGWAISASGAKVYSDKQSVSNLTKESGGIVNLYAVWTANNYTVKFNANGGSGTMATQSFVYGEAKNLTANAFTRAGYTFLGWTTSASGAKVYSDKQSVKNLTSSSNGSVNLYAVWESALSVSVLSAKQRYPWNGLVDVKCVLEGGANQNYNVAFLVNDEAGGTNIPVRTFWQIGGNTTNEVLTVKPGNLHFVWDANADIAEDGEFPAVSITVNVEPAVDVMEVKVLNNAN